MSAKALLSASVSAPPAVYVEDVFSTFLYTGNGGTQTITNGIDLTGEGGLVWTKNRGRGTSANLIDSVRGITKKVVPSSTAAEATVSYMTSFNTTGYTINGNNDEMNLSADTYVGWTFRKAPKFFDVVTYTGNGAVGRQLSHSLGSTPGCIFVKCTSDASTPWIVYHRSIVSTGWLELASTTAVRDFGAGSGLVPFGTITSTYATLYDAFTETNATAKTYVAYLFAHDAGGFGDAGTDNVISCGTTTVSSNTASVTLGYEPQWVMMKRTSGISDWFLVDNMRGFSSSASPFLRANDSSIESPNAGTQCNATGFTSSGVFDNGTYIYIAIRRGPMKTPTVGTEVFAPVAYSGNDADNDLTTSFPVDLGLITSRNATAGFFAVDRLRGPNIWPLDTWQSAAESTLSGYIKFDSNTQFKIINNGISRINSSARTYVLEAFRRAPGFFDVVAYTGTGANLAVSHNLGVAPEMMIVKNRAAEENWTVSHIGRGAPWARFNSFLNTNIAFDEYVNFYQNPTATQFFVTPDRSASAITYIAYLFATCPGVSKVGSYTGTGTTLNVDCGFTAGARFVLIKRTDSTGDWFVWDTARGIISGNDPYLLLNSNAAEVTGTDYIDPLSTGFQISSTAPAAINANGGNFIFLAIA